MPLTRLTAACLATAAALALPAAADAATSTSTPSKPQHLTTRVLVKKFVVRKTGLTALGTAATTVGGNSTRQVVALQARTGATCEVLTLRLDRLNLALLGLRLDVSAVNLRITGNRARTLGALFCKLATSTRLGNLASTRAAAASLNRRLRARPLQMIGFNAALYPKTAAAPAAPAGATTRQTSTSTTPPASAPTGPTCPVLDLTLGPLSLDLLGLVVDLYGQTNRDPVRVTAVADPAAGILGKALCQISTQAPAA
ncbi:hypothetical protein NBH00_07805 [Paraconexibacter antarcticus]|uniref:CHRD domain-containing protein n=1 Tax=Paraconexibacter antarcticus TaxID=2949664 RepID=A0ABY5DZV8_9ACTN|nr:hypothetical protein [Paraconexibacter antarcticus]UTI66099.1 hypothetical protein NBH00_07805 [Paraconexibacter antarcticus]